MTKKDRQLIEAAQYFVELNKEDIYDIEWDHLGDVIHLWLVSSVGAAEFDLLSSDDINELEACVKSLL